MVLASVCLVMLAALSGLCWAAPISYTEARVPLLAQQALVCWPTDLTLLVNESILFDNEVVADRDLAAFFARFQVRINGGEPLCSAYAHVALGISRMWAVRTNANVKWDAASSYVQYCREELATTPLAALATVRASGLQSDHALRKCMNAVAMAAIVAV